MKQETNEFNPYEQALALKELGFDEPCLAHLIGFGDGTQENGLYKIKQQQVFYPGDYASSDDKAEELGLHPFVICGVPLFQQAFRWFREKYKLEAIVQKADDFSWYKFTIYFYLSDSKGFVDSYHEFNTYEEAELACLIKLIEIVKNK
jgi:hypothetical protein